MIYEIIGWLGTFLILLAYLLVSIGKVISRSWKYQLLNLFGAIGIIINSLVHQAIPSVGLNVIWSIIALYTLLKIVKK